MSDQVAAGARDGDLDGLPVRALDVVRSGGRSRTTAMGQESRANPDAGGRRR